MLKLKELKAVLKEYDVKPNKRLGQNFLIDENVRNKMLSCMDIGKEDTVIEIGPGLGAITDALCDRSGKVIAVEKDRRLYDYLLKNRHRANLELIRQDILEYDFDMPCGSPLKIAGNLPYYISSPILIRLLQKRKAEAAFITVQKEFAERLVAEAGTKAYGSITCFTRFYSEPTMLFAIKKNAFYPEPKVDSAFLKIKIHKTPLYLTNEEKLFRMIKAAFEKRRKMIINGLYAGGGFASKEELVAKLRMAGISPSARPEQVPLQDFIRLTDVLTEGEKT